MELGFNSIQQALLEQLLHAMGLEVILDPEIFSKGQNLKTYQSKIEVLKAAINT